MNHHHLSNSYVLKSLEWRFKNPFNAGRYNGRKIELMLMVCSSYSFALLQELIIWHGGQISKAQNPTRSAAWTLDSFANNTMLKRPSKSWLAHLNVSSWRSRQYDRCTLLGLCQQYRRYWWRTGSRLELFPIRAALWQILRSVDNTSISQGLYLWPSCVRYAHGRPIPGPRRRRKHVQKIVPRVFRCYSPRLYLPRGLYSIPRNDI
jgi:hypothetical protein